MESEIQKKEFARRFNLGENGGLEFFYNEFYSGLVFYSSSILKDTPIAQEIVSEAFLKTWKHHFRLETYSGIKAYLYTVVQRDSVRKAEKLRRVVSLEVCGDDCSESDTCEKLIAAETIRLLHNAIKTLHPKTRIVIEEFYLNNKTAAEIAAGLGLPPSTIRSQKMRGILELKKRLNAN